MRRPFRSLLSRYGFAALAVAVALLIRLALDPLLGDGWPFLLFSFVVVAVAWHGGFGPSCLALVASILAASYFFLEPRYSLAQSLVGHPIQCGGFLLLGLVIALFSERLRWAGRRAEAQTREALRQRDELEQEVKRRKHLEDELREADRRKDEFLAMLGHELRNPLAPIRNAVEILRMLASNDPRLQRVEEMIDRQVKHLARLVDDLLDVSRITRGKVQLSTASVDLAAVVARAVDASRPLIESRCHELTVTLPPGPVVVEADATRLGQVVGNLLSNAAKYTPESGHIRLTVEVAPSPQPPSPGERGAMGEAVLRVRDDGIGITADLLPRVFDLFTQGDQSLARSEGGLGIGLTLVKRLVEMHGGTVEARSEGMGRGSEFVVRLPCPLSLALGPLPDTRDLGQGTRDKGQGSGLRILVVDDNADAAESLALLLLGAGHEVHTAHDGPAALEAARAIRPDAVVLDIGLPRMDGYEVARRLCGEPGLARPLLVALTGYGQEEDRRRVEEAGFDAYLVKPAEPETLRALLADLGNGGTVSRAADSLE
jgi:two-component system CheB/CheR fusion protein